MTKPEDVRMGLDLALKTGFAVRLDDDILASGVWDFSPRAGDGAGIRFCRLEAALIAMFNTWHVMRVSYELPAIFRSRAAGASVHGMVAVLQKVCETMQIPYEAFPPTSVKKHATGKGNAKKDQMIEAAKAKWPEVNIIDDNLADALWVLDMSYDH